jgi:hypothetical protein
MTETGTTIYLSKNDKIFGPYSQTEIEALKADGKFGQFFWVCYDLKKGWEPVHPAPPLPTPGTAQHAPLEELEATPQKKKLRSDIRTDTSIVALCRARTTIISGLLRDITENGGTLIEVHPHSHSVPWFRKGAKVQMNLLDSKNSKTQNIQAKVSDIQKKDGSWSYVVQWSNLPEIFG